MKCFNCSPNIIPKEAKPYNLEILLLGIYLKQLKRYSYTMFIVALVTTKMWRQSKCLLIDKWICDIYTQ